MEEYTPHYPPRRVTDLILLKTSGSQVNCDPSFEIVPVDFTHRDHQFQAHIFLCRYIGTVNGDAYQFRKCYARGCPHNLCPHVAQAVMIANRYLQRDFHRMRAAGIEMPERMFTLDDMLVKFDALSDDDQPLLTIHDYINIAKENNAVSVSLHLEYVSVVEHFAHEKNKQTFLNADFSIDALGKAGAYQRCFGCYGTENEKGEKPGAVLVANQRLSLLYREFDEAGIRYEKHFFE